MKLAAIGRIVNDQHMQTIRNGVYAAGAALLRFSRTCPLSCPTIILPGLPLSDIVSGQIGDRP